jgi:serine phosphatase RsbU (regulator of sigma subunit)
MNEQRPDSVLESLNQALLAHMADDDSERFCTAIVGALTVSRDEVVLDLASGGHPYPIVRHPDGSIETIRLGGSLLGQFDTIEVAHRRVSLRPGDVFLMFTDGVVEGRPGGSGGAFFDTRRVRDVLAQTHQSARRVVEALEEAVLAYSGGRLHDDVAAVALRIPVPSA